MLIVILRSSSEKDPSLRSGRQGRVERHPEVVILSEAKDLLPQAPRPSAQLVSLAVQNRFAILSNSGVLVSRRPLSTILASSVEEFGGKKMVGVERFELPTSCSQSRRATRLRYTPTCLIKRAGSYLPVGKWSIG